MFTGIIQGRFPVSAVRRRPGSLELSIRLSGNTGRGLARGASVSVSGVCLTVVASVRGVARFFVMGETIRRTTLGKLVVGDAVNIERSARLDSEIGGHLVSGHIAGTARIAGIRHMPGTVEMTFVPDPPLRRYIFPQGFIALDGVSLTVAAAGARDFSVHFIPETLTRTTFGLRRRSDRVNVEIDPLTRAVVDTARRLLSNKKP